MVSTELKNFELFNQKNSMNTEFLMLGTSGQVQK